MCGCRLWARLRSLRAFADGLGADAACAFLAVGATWALLSRLGVRPMGFEDRIVLFDGGPLPRRGVRAGARRRVAPTAGRVRCRPCRPHRARDWHPDNRSRVPRGRGRRPRRRLARRGRWHRDRGRSSPSRPPRPGRRPARPAPAVAGVALLLSMPLAVVWATTSWLGIAFLSVPLMAATHGALNVVGFAVPAVFAWRKATVV